MWFCCFVFVFDVGGLLVLNSVDYYVMSFRFNELLSLWCARVWFVAVAVVLLCWCCGTL